MKYRTVLLAATIAATPIASSAEISGGFGLSFGRISAEGSSEELNNTRLDFNLNYDSGSAFGFGLNGSTSRLTGGADDLTVNNLDGEVFYGLANGYRVGAYAGTLSLTGGLEETLSTYGLFAGMSGEGYTVDLSLGEVKVDDVTVNEASIRGMYALSQSTQLMGELGRTWNSANSNNVFALGASHDLSDQVNVFGGLNLITVSSSDDRFTTVSLGIAYDLATLSSFGATGWLELSRTSISDSDEPINRVSFGISMPLGEGASGAPLGSRVGFIGRGNRSPYQSLFSNGYLGAL